MRSHLTILGILGWSLAGAQSVTSVYNRDTHEAFRLKGVHVDSTVVGPLVKTSTVLTYDNPYKTLTEATLNFVLPDAAALGGFAYFYGDEYVRGQLMDKNKAWFIYTAITSRGRDPGIMEQWSPTDYHCQIFPIKQGCDLKIRLWTIGTLVPVADQMQVPKPSVPRAVGYVATDKTIANPDWKVRAVKTGVLTDSGDRYSVEMKSPVMAVAQRFKDGRIYVAGLVHNPRSSSKSSIKILSAFYEPLNSSQRGAEVTTKVTDLVRQGSYSIDASNLVFGDPNPGIVKQLRVTYSRDGQTMTKIVTENDRVQLLSKDRPDSSSPTDPTFYRLRQPKIVNLDPDTMAFSGWLPKNMKIALRFYGHRYAFKPQLIAGGSDAARLWAQQILAGHSLRRRSDVLAFSMKYGVPSTATALLAVPEEEMKLFRDKEKDYQKAQAVERRRQLEIERQRRNWASKRTQNWNASGGGDPEIRVEIPGAKSVEAILPDRRVLDLKQDGDVWGGNFEIPANALEGTYSVKIVGHMPDGTTVERSWTYDVDRTAPKGQAKFLVENGHLILEVKSESGLAEVAAYASDGHRWVLHEDSPGTYRIEIPKGTAVRLTVVLKDRAGNKGELLCSLPH